MLNHSKKIIGLNLISLPNQMAGIGFLAINLFRQFIPQYSEFHFIVYSSKNVSLKQLEFSNSTVRRIAPAGSIIRIIWEQFKMPTNVKKDNVNLIINVHYTALLFLKFGIPQLTLIPDLTYQKYFLSRKFIKSLIINILMPLSILKSKGIVVISDFTHNELIRYFPFVKNKNVSVMPLAPGGVDEMYAEEADVEVLQEFGLKENRFFLFVGTVEPTKNLMKTVKAFRSFEHDNKGYKFVIVGKRGWQDKKDWRFQKLEKFISQCDLTDKVIFTGYLKSKELKALYSNTTALVFASLYEGFGIPILEAMLLRAPVITSNISSMPEVAGIAACLVNPLSDLEISNAMKLLANNSNYREELIIQGTDHVKKYSWTKSAMIMHRACSDILKKVNS